MFSSSSSCEVYKKREVACMSLEHILEKNCFLIVWVLIFLHSKAVTVVKNNLYQGWLIYSKLLARFYMLVFFTNLSLKEVQVRYSVLFCLFSITDSCGLFRMGRILKNIQLMLEFFRASFLVLHFSYYTLITFVMLSVILLFMLMTLLSTRSVIRHLVSGNN